MAIALYRNATLLKMRLDSGAGHRKITARHYLTGYVEVNKRKRTVSPAWCAGLDVHSSLAFDHLMSGEGMDEFSTE